MTFEENCRKLIESGECDADCCGIIHFPPELIKETEHLAQAPVISVSKDEKGIIPLCADHKCPYLNRTSKKCMIYDRRPPVCRLYGFAEQLQCPYLKRSGTLRTPAKRKQVQRKINREVDEFIRKLK